MFIELTDLLRCPVDHEEAYLVLIPTQLVGRTVRRGVLGCPLCRREYLIEDGVALLTAGRTTGGSVPFVPISQRSQPSQSSPGHATPEALATFLGLDGPGGFVGVLGETATLGDRLAALLPGIHLVAINPPAELAEAPNMSLVQADEFPLKARSLRGIVIGVEYAADVKWASRAAAAVLPGLRVVGQGPEHPIAGLEPLASAGGWWVGKRKD